MLDCLGDDGYRDFPQVERRIVFASDLQALWYLRPELLMVVSAVAGERAAQAKIARISALFDGLLPQGLSSRRVGPAR